MFRTLNFICLGLAIFAEVHGSMKAEEHFPDESVSWKKNLTSKELLQKYSHLEKYGKSVGQLVDEKLCNGSPFLYDKDKCVTFYVYTKPTTEGPISFEMRGKKTTLSEGDIANVKTKVNPRLPVFVGTHGWGGTKDDIFTYEFAQEILNKVDVTLITIDWSKLSTTVYAPPLYILAKKNTVLVGSRAALMLAFLIKENVVALCKIHVFGFSLGAHVAGIIGDQFYRNENMKIPHITGLDPAGPLYRKTSPSEKLTSDDADFVDVIHTFGQFIDQDSPIPLTGLDDNVLTLGDYLTQGTIDFYPHYGAHPQPQCAEKDFNCSHQRAKEYYLESIIPKSNYNLTAYKCPNLDSLLYKSSGSVPTCDMTSLDTTVMGIHANKSKTGIFVSFPFKTG